MTRARRARGARARRGGGSAREALAAGSLTVLASDYHPPSPLAAACALADGHVCSWAEALSLVTANPARADLAAVGRRSGLPVVAGTWVAGRQAR